MHNPQPAAARPSYANLTLNKQFLTAVFGTDWEQHCALENSGEWNQRKRLEDLTPGTGHYWSPGSIPAGRTRRNENVLDVRALAIDDVGTKVRVEDLTAVLPTQPTAVVETSAGNFQWVWRLKDGMTPEAFAAFRDHIAMLLPGARDAKAVSNLFRLPSGVNQKEGRGGFKPRLVSQHDAAGLTGAQVATLMLGAPPTRASGPRRRPREIMPIDRITSLLDLYPNGFTVDYDAWVRVAHAVKAMAEDDEEGFAVFDAWSQGWDGPYSEADTRRLWDSISADNVVTTGGMLKEIIAAEDPEGFGRWRQEGAPGAFDDGADVRAAVRGLEEMTGVPFGSDQQRGARAVLTYMQGRIRKLGDGDWREFDAATGRWKAWPGNHALRVVDELASQRRRKPLDTAVSKKLGTKTFLAGIAALISVNADLIATEQDFDREAMLLGVPSGVIDLAKGASRDVRRGTVADMVSKTTAVDPAPRGTPHPIWSKFLSEFTQGDASLELWLQVYAGYALTGLTREHIMPFFYGSGGNGKSVFLNALRGVWGEYGAQIDHRLMFAKQGGFHLAPLAALMGVRLGTVTDVSPGSQWDTQLLKMLTGGDSVTANRMHGNPFSFVPTAKLMISGNDMPGLRDMDDGVRRRMRMLPLKGKPKAIDVKLPDRLQAEWPAILRWALEGLDLYWAGGMPASKVIDDETEGYMLAQDPFGPWVDKALVPITAATKDRLMVGDLFRAWDAYRCGVGMADAAPRSPTTLSRALSAKGITTAANNRGSFVVGYRLTSSGDIGPF